MILLIYIFLIHDSILFKESLPFGSYSLNKWSLNLASLSIKQYLHKLASRTLPPSEGSTSSEEENVRSSK